MSQSSAASAMDVDFLTQKRKATAAVETAMKTASATIMARPWVADMAAKSVSSRTEIKQSNSKGSGLRAVKEQTVSQTKAYRRCLFMENKSRRHARKTFIEHTKGSLEATVHDKHVIGTCRRRTQAASASGTRRLGMRHGCLIVWTIDIGPALYTSGGSNKGTAGLANGRRL